MKKASCSDATITTHSRTDKALECIRPAALEFGSPRPSEGLSTPPRDTEDNLVSILARLERRVENIELGIDELRDFNAATNIPKESYSTLEIARILNKRPYTVREWCRLGRIKASKTHMGRGIEKEWRVDHEELVRIQNEGLLPLPRLSVGRVNSRR